MDVLVTGARGFVGLNVVRQLAADGATVWAVDRSPQDAWTDGFLAGVETSIRHVIADLTVPGELAGSVAVERLDAVVHAAVVTAMTAEVEKRDARDIADSNVGGTIEALTTAVGLSARRFIYVSSPSAFGPVDSIASIDESVATRPDSLYGITKLASEQITVRWAELFDLEVATVRIAQPYGPGERPTSARVRTSPIQEWLVDASRGDRLSTGPLDRARDWTYIDDTAQGIGRLVNATRLSHSLYHLGTGRQVSVAEVVNALGARLGDLECDLQPSADDLNPNISGPGRPPLDASRFQSEFGWKPDTSIDVGMQRYMEWWDKLNAAEIL